MVGGQQVGVPACECTNVSATPSVAHPCVWILAYVRACMHAHAYTHTYTRTHACMQVGQGQVVGMSVRLGLGLPVRVTGR